MSAQPWLTMYSKGEVFEGKIIAVSSGSTEYQDKLLFQVCLRDPNSKETSPEPSAEDFHADEVVMRGSTSRMRERIGQKVSFVIISVGKNGQKPWVKIDEQRVACPLDSIGKVVLATDCFKIACDLIVSGKAEGFTFKNIQDLSKRISDHVLTLANNL